MQLNKQTDYAFRVLIFLSSFPRDRLVTTLEISKAFDISRNHLMKIVQKLVQQEYIASTRGVKGGLSLAKEPAEIGLYEIVDLMQVSKDSFDCHLPPCKLQGFCALKGVFDKAQKAFLDTFKDYTLADVLNSSMKEILLRD